MSTGTEHRWVMKLYVPTGSSDEEALQEARATLRDLIRDDGYVLDPTSIARGTELAIRLDESGGFDEWDGIGVPDGRIVEFTAAATERIVDDPNPATTRVGDDGAVYLDVPAELTRTGGGIRMAHDLGAPVTVTAFDADGDPTGYLFAQPIDDNIEHVELVPGAARLRAVPDPVDAEPGP